MSPRTFTLSLFVLAVSSSPVGTTLAAEPSVLDERLQLTLVAEHPQIVTPIGCTYDHLGRLLVVESHTHLPPDDYAGPKTDRIQILVDNDGDGRADIFTTFYDGHKQRERDAGNQANGSLKHTMSLAAADEWVYVATRMEVFRLRDADGDGCAELRENLVSLQTDGDYPHNGLGGLAFDTNGDLLFGLGENLGKPYAIVGSDGATLTGGGEGGNIYRCQRDGAQLGKIATGFWNPFGICVDPTGRVFSVGNDPDASPPCRLVHVVETGDYGYQFRFGRSGLHPLQAWNGELPGTLPMMAGTGEAPCAVLPYYGHLWVSSWGDYRIERFKLVPNGVSFTASREIVVQGDNHFRPVDFAVAPDGSLVFTDWVQKSYPVHGQGRVWRLSWKVPPTTALHDLGFPDRTPGERQSISAASELKLQNMDSADPFLQTATIQAIAKQRAYQDRSTGKFNVAAFQTGKQWLGAIAAARWNNVADPLQSELIAESLKNADPDVQLYAVRWVAEKSLQQFRSSLEELAKTNRTSLPLFQATVAALEWLDKGETNNATRTDFYARVLDEPSDFPPLFLIEALRNLSGDRLEFDSLKKLVDHPDLAVQRAAVRTFALSQLEGRQSLLRQIGDDEHRHIEMRLDAKIGVEVVKKVEAAKIDHLPNTSDIDAWVDLLAESEGDSNRGWRIFFGSGDGRCANCHTYQGRGASVGPDLTLAAQRLDRRRLVESILQPSREVAPQYVVTNLETTDGRILSGLSLGAGDDGETEDFMTPNGDRFTLKVSEIERRTLSNQSVMPDGLERAITIDELRDLLSLFDH